MQLLNTEVKHRVVCLGLLVHEDRKGPECSTLEPDSWLNLHNKFAKMTFLIVYLCSLVAILRYLNLLKDCLEHT